MTLNSRLQAALQAFLNPMPQSLKFEDISIQQEKNLVKSRLSIDTTSEVIKGVFLKVPLLSSNMSTVTNAKFASLLNALGGLGVLHRAQPVPQLLEEVKEVASCSRWVAASIGVGDSQYTLAEKLIDQGANILFIDIAHGYSEEVDKLGQKIKTKYPQVKVVAGNTINPQMLRDFQWADAIKVGIGQSPVCTTKNTAGCTEGQFSAVLKFKALSKKYNIPVISDGGIREPADFTKAIAAGANSVMAGKIFVTCPESAAEVIVTDDGPRKVYEGMASREVQEKWRGGLKPGTCAEGKQILLPIDISLEETVTLYQGALRSGITYAGARNVYEFQERAKFIRLK